MAFHAGTARSNGELVTNGGRVLGMTGLGKNFREARSKAYAVLQGISFEGMHFRHDIAGF